MRDSEAVERLEHRRILEDLLSIIGVGAEETGGEIRIDGVDPVVSSRHRLGGATACALAAHGAALAAIWKMRTGRGQDISVDVRRAVVPGLATCFHLSQNGHPIEPLAPNPKKWFFRTRDDRWFL